MNKLLLKLKQAFWTLYAILCCGCYLKDYCFYLERVCDPYADCSQCQKEDGARE